VSDARIIDLRRRVHADPASLSFAELAEQLRREGATDEAVEVCRAGLSHHPNYFTARVTLGRALTELDRLGEAFTELTTVLDAAPGHLPAIRALAEIYQRRGMMSEALVHYRRALQLSQGDVDLEHTVGEIQQLVEPAQQVPPAAPAPQVAGANAVPIEDLFNFDSLVAQLAPAPDAPAPVVPQAAPVPSVIDTVQLPQDDQDSFALMERQLREHEEQRLIEERQAREADAEQRRRMLVMEELENWLAAIAADRGPEQQQA
jgi:tetratricopeptide (TPR) repeat protein